MLLIKETQLANGLTLSFYDCSKPLAADRWLVKMRGEMRFAVAEAVWPAGSQDDPELHDLVRGRLGESVALVLDRERNFIDADAKEAVVTELVAQIEANLLGYLGDPSFPQRLFVRRYEEMCKQCALERLQRPAPVDDDDDGPADFSACFRD